MRISDWSSDVCSSDLSMSWAQSIVLGAVQGLTEFLPVSSSGHLRIVSEVWFGDDAGASFTAVTQLGTEAAVLVYFRSEERRVGKECVSTCRSRGSPYH